MMRFIRRRWGEQELLMGTLCSKRRKSLKAKLRNVTIETTKARREKNEDLILKTL